MNNLQKNNINNDGAYTRKKAIEILVKILENNKPLDNAFEESTKKSSHFSKLINEDKSFCRLIISTTLRNLISIDYLLTKFLSKPLNKTPLKVLMILRINVAQSFFLKTPDHAVVNTSVELSGKKWKGLVNGVSREILRNKDKAKKYLNEKIDKMEFSECSVGFTDGQIGSSRIEKTIRSSTGLYLQDNSEVANFIHERMNEVLLVYRDNLINEHEIFDSYPVPGGKDTTSHREIIQILDYVKEQKYVFHVDESSMVNSKEFHRKIAIIIYLSEGFEGGYTEFVHKKFKPAAGYGLIFPSNWCFPHSGTEVISGKKRVAVTWYHVDDQRCIGDNMIEPFVIQNEKQAEELALLRSHQQINK